MNTYRPPVLLDRSAKLLQRQLRVIPRSGRFCRDASPVSLDANSCPAKIPESSRIVVPEFPASSARQLDFNPRAPRPVIRTVSPAAFTSAPRDPMQASEL